MRRLRQVAIASLDRDRVVRSLTETLGIEVGFEDPAIGTLGLHNAVLPIGDQFLEVVAASGASTSSPSRPRSGSSSSSTNPSPSTVRRLRIDSTTGRGRP